MSDINNCTFTGRLGADPEVKSFQSGDKIANARLAVGQQWKKDGEKNERTEWVSLVFRGGLVGVVESYLRKGSQIAVTGQMVTRKWQAQDGSDRYSTEIQVRDMTMIGGKSEGAGGGTKAAATGGRSFGDFDNDLDDDVPFATNDVRFERRVF
jgi:single-strand DNA-binding protein